ncbi:MAG: dihydroorotase, partial [Longimicrobiales bacterium]
MSMQGARPLLLKGGHVIDPSTGQDGIADVLLADGLIESVDADLTGPDGAEVVDVAGLIVCPGLIDVHVHLREPG